MVAPRVELAECRAAIFTGRCAASLPELAEELIRRAAAVVPAHTDVLLDIEVDGVRCVVTRTADAQREPAIHEILSPREQEIARMIARGHPNKTIAAALEISSWTVNAHLRRIFTKLGVTSRAAMVARLLEPHHA